MPRIESAAARAFLVGCGNPGHELTRRADMSWRDYLIALLNTAASLEHALMVQYLFAAYSLGGEQVPVAERSRIGQWQQSLLSIAREEMGHLLTVQNVLTFLGAPVSFARNLFPLTSEWFSLEPLTTGSLACYVYAEMPDDEHMDDFPEQPEIMARANQHLKSKGIAMEVGQLYPVNEVYSKLMLVLASSDYIPESAFHPETYSSQASWDDWGRGYQPPPRPLDAEGNLLDDPAPVPNGRPPRAHVLVDRVASRTQALAALQALSAQGEGPHESGDEPTHFDRLLEIYKEYKQIERSGWSPALPVAANPGTVEAAGGSFISSEVSRHWANLFNVRYRILLTYLAHTFRLARLTRPDEPSVRAMLMHRVFTEMYNLKTLAGILVRLPLTEAPNDTRRAGPPFELPYNQTLPAAEVDCWRLHLNDLRVAGELCKNILDTKSPAGRTWLHSIVDLDAQTTLWLRTILAGQSAMEGHAV